MKGFESAIDPATGQPVFRPASPAAPADDPDDIYWDNSISPSVAGVGGTCLCGNCLRWQADCCRGVSSAAGDVIANYIASWDGTSWSALGIGDEMDRCLCPDGVRWETDSRGRFTRPVAWRRTRIASWDGSVMVAVGVGDEITMSMP